MRKSFKKTIAHFSGVRKIILIKTLFSLLSGLLLSVCFLELGFLAWISLLPLLFSLYKSTLKQSLFYTFLCGLTYFMGICYWLAVMSVQAWIILSLCLTPFFLVFGIIAHFVLSRISFPYLRILMISGAWVLIEYSRSFTAFAFPIGLLGDSQYSFLPLMQFARYTGIWGISLLVVLFNMAVFEAIAGLAKIITEYRLSTSNKVGGYFSGHDDRNYHLWNRIISFLRYPAIVGMVILIVAISGIPVMNNNLHRAIKSRNLEEIKLSIVQPNIPLGEKYKGGSSVIIPEKYCPERYFKPGTELVIFPESILWGNMEEEENLEFSQWAEETMQNENLYLLIGQVVPLKDYEVYGSSVDRENGKSGGAGRADQADSEGKSREKFHNSVLFYDPSMNLIGKYNEIHPIPFTQYTPYPRFLKFLSFLDYTVVDIIPGDDYTPFYFPEKGGIGTIVCFESIIPQISRNFRKNGAEAIIVISDQSSCLDTRVPWNSFNISARARAIENGCYIVQCANTGISGIISPSGEVIVDSQLLNKEVLYGSIFLMPEVEKTFYSKFGELIMYVYWGIVFCLGCFYFCKSRKNLFKNRLKHR